MNSEDAPKNEPLHAALVRTISESTLGEEIGAAVEVLWDAEAAPGLVRDLPVINLLLGAKDFSSRWSDAMLARKILKFLSAVGYTPLERAEMIRRLDVEPEFEGRVGERLLNVLHRLDDTEKATLVGRAFRAFLCRQIDGSTLARLVAAIDHLLLSDLSALPTYHLRGPTSAVTLQAYLAVGLAHIPHGMATAHYVETLDLTIPMLRYVLRAERV